MNNIHIAHPLFAQKGITMEIRVGKYILRSDRFCMWIDEEREVKEGKTKGKKTTTRVAGYSQNLEQLYRSFVQHKYKSAEATTVKELLKVFQQTEFDLMEIRKTATKEDFRIIRQLAKEIDKK